MEGEVDCQHFEHYNVEKHVQGPVDACTDHHVLLEVYELVHDPPLHCTIILGEQEILTCILVSVIVINDRTGQKPGIHKEYNSIRGQGEFLPVFLDQPHAGDEETRKHAICSPVVPGLELDKMITERCVDIGYMDLQCLIKIFIIHLIKYYNNL